MLQVKFVLKILLSFTLFLVVTSNSTKASGLISKEYDQALFEILNLRTKSAKKILDGVKNQKFDLYKEYLYNWGEAIELTVSEDEKKYKNYLETLDARFDRIEEQADKTSESYHIILADIYTHAAMVNIYYGDYLAGFGKLMKANKNVRLNETKFPNCWRNNKLCGTLNVSFATLSNFWRKVAGIFSLTGDLNKGFQQLNTYLHDVKDYRGLRSEAILYYGAALKIAKDEEQAYELLKKNVIKEEAPALELFLTSNVFYNTSRNEEAIAYLEYFPSSQIEINFQYFDYLMGKEKLTRLEDDAPKYLENFLNNSKLKNYHREICLRIAHFYFMKSDTVLYRKYLKKMDDFSKPSIDRDREADVEKNKPYLPDRDLLKARYLVTGGYFNEASAILDKLAIKRLDHTAQKNEYYVLLATVKNNENQSSYALSICDQLIKEQKNSNDQFPAEAALLAGNICIQKKDLKSAEKYFNLALEIDGNDDIYIEHIHKKAKNQLNRIKQKTI